MLDSGTYTATLDRFEETPGGDLAVLVVDRDADALAQVDLPVEVIPDAGRRVDAVFDLVVAPDRFELAYRADESERRAEAAQTRFDRLAQRPPSDTEE
jgi:hypothetical protein